MEVRRAGGCGPSIFRNNHGLVLDIVARLFLTTQHNTYRHQETGNTSLILKATQFHQ